MLRCESTAPLPRPNRVSIHSAPVKTPERRVHALMNTRRKIWLKTGQTKGSQMLFTP
jgi:hypothetical protein